MLIVSQFDIESNFDDGNNRNIFQETDVFFADENADYEIVNDKNKHQMLINNEYFSMSIFQILSLILVKENNEMKISILPI
jgi:hypothetical protein